MLLAKKKEFPEELRNDLKQHVYDIIGYAMDVCRQLPCGLPEYVYQEAFAKTLTKHGIDPHKEFRHYPLYDGVPLEAYIKMDFMIERKLDKSAKQANIIVEAKAIEKLTNKERSQLFGYMVGTRFPVGLLVNFATYPWPTIERYYFDPNDMTISAF